MTVEARARVASVGADSLAAAESTGRWLAARAERSPSGVVWPEQRCSRPPYLDLYGGSAGIILFLLELSRSTGEERYERLAIDAGNHMLATTADLTKCGLYTGLAGLPSAFEALFAATGAERFRDGTVECVRRLKASSVVQDNGAAWNQSTDILGGSAGIGLSLLWLAGLLQDDQCADLAEAAATHLIQVAQASGDGLWWHMDPEFERTMPNFSRGTAGVAYFLASLARQTGPGPALDAALAGGRHLLNIADLSGGGCQVYYSKEGGEDLYYLGWCHGPAGTARLFQQLANVTGDERWQTWVTRSARSVLDAVLPGRQLPGFWDNVGQCCGSAAVAMFAMDVYRITRDGECVDFAQRIVQDILARAGKDQEGMYWVHSPTRLEPDVRVAIPGYSQGAAGVGLALLRMDALEKDRPWQMALPDNPFGATAAD